MAKLSTGYTSINVFVLLSLAVCIMLGVAVCVMMATSSPTVHVRQANCGANDACSLQCGLRGSVS